MLHSPSSSAPRLWGLVVRGFTAALWSNGTLARLELVLPPLGGCGKGGGGGGGGSNGVVVVGGGVGTATTAPTPLPHLLAALHSAALAAPAARRLAIACAGHARGATSPMHALPLEVLGAIMDVAVPDRACEVEVLVCGGGERAG